MAKKSRPSRPGIERFDDRAGCPRFRLVARNGAVLMTSEAYDTAQGRDKGVRSVVRVMREYIKAVESVMEAPGVPGLE